MMAHHGFQQDLHAVDVVVEILQRLLHALADERIRREMDDGLDVVFGKNLVEHGRIADVALIEFRFRVQSAAMACLEVVDDDDVLALRHELMHSMRTDVTGAATNENRHDGQVLSESFLVYHETLTFSSNFSVK